MLSALAPCTLNVSCQDLQVTLWLHVNKVRLHRDMHVDGWTKPYQCHPGQRGFVSQARGAVHNRAAYRLALFRL